METEILASRGKIVLTIDGATEEDLLRFQEIFVALISCGGLSGVKGGQTIIHFDGDGKFVGVQLSYWPWRRRKALTP